MALRKELSINQAEAEAVLAYIHGDADDEQDVVGYNILTNYWDNAIRLEPRPHETIESRLRYWTVQLILDKHDLDIDP